MLIRENIASDIDYSKMKWVVKQIKTGTGKGKRNILTEYNPIFAGNRDEVKVDGATVKDYTVTDNKIQSVVVDGSTISYSYDYKGNLTGKGADTYEWDYNNRLIGANVNGVSIGYKYSSNDLRLAKEKDGEVTYYFYNGNKLLCEKDGGGKVTKVYTQDNEGLLAMTRYVYKDNGSFSHYQPFYYTFNDMGSVVMITNRQGQVVQYYLYDPWGDVTNTENDPVNNFSFIGRYGGFKDWDTGFVQFHHRWYDSDDGRWISKDPIGVEGGMNVYLYSGNNSINKIDPLGLAYFAKREFEWIGITATNPLDDVLNTEIVHEQLFFEDKNNPSNLGFFPTGQGLCSPGIVKMDEPTGKTYFAFSEKFNDCIMRLAVQNVNMPTWCLFGSNCQDWASAVRKVYYRLNNMPSIHTYCEVSLICLY